MIDFGFETQGRRLERVFGRQTEMQIEDSALQIVNELIMVEWRSVRDLTER